MRRITSATGFFHPAEIDVAVELVDERLAKGDASGYHFLLLDADAHPVAYACYGPIACTAASYDLYWLATDPAYQGQGLGTRLLHEAEIRIWQRGGRRIYIETSGRPRYAATRGFYLHRGYTQAAVLPDYYDDGDDKVVYHKSAQNVS